MHNIHPYLNGTLLLCYDAHLLRWQQQQPCSMLFHATCPYLFHAKCPYLHDTWLGMMLTVKRQQQLYSMLPAQLRIVMSELQCFAMFGEKADLLLWMAMLSTPWQDAFCHLYQIGDVYRTDFGNSLALYSLALAKADVCIARSGSPMSWEQRTLRLPDTAPM